MFQRSLSLVVCLSMLIWAGLTNAQTVELKSTSNKAKSAKGKDCKAKCKTAKDRKACFQKCGDAVRTKKKGKKGKFSENEQATIAKCKDKCRSSKDREACSRECAGPELADKWMGKGSKGKAGKKGKKGQGSHPVIGGKKHDKKKQIVAECREKCGKAKDPKGCTQKCVDSSAGKGKAGKGKPSKKDKAGRKGKLSEKEAQIIGECKAKCESSKDRQGCVRECAGPEIADRWMGKSKKGKKGKKGAAGKKGKKGKKGQGGAVIGGPSTKGPKSIKKRNCKVRCKGDKACMSKCRGKK